MVGSTWGFFTCVGLLGDFMWQVMRSVSLRLVAIKSSVNTAYLLLHLRFKLLF